MGIVCQYQGFFIKVNKLVCRILNLCLSLVNEKRFYIG